jgi:hypothetical protein
LISTPLVSALRLDFLISTPWLLTIAFLAIATAAPGFHASRRNGYGPFWLGLVAAAVILAGKFLFDAAQVTYAGVGLLIAASVWNSWPRRHACDKPDIRRSSPEASILAIFVIGPYLFFHIVILSALGLLAWVEPPTLVASPVFNQYVAPHKHADLENIVLAASAAGIGGAVYMVREFYLSVNPRPFGDRKALRLKEIPRYVLLPFSSVVLGPVGFSLLLAGSIVFNGFSPAGPVPHFTVVAISFLLGFAYHDTLKALTSLSRRIFTKESQADNNKEAAADNT